MKAKKGKIRLYTKLNMRYYDPFQILEKINDVAYKLKRPTTWTIHNAFHVSLIKPFHGEILEDLKDVTQPKVEEQDEVLVVEQIMAHHYRKIRGRVSRCYRVKFKNYPILDA